jgi:hypothetical protein
MATQTTPATTISSTSTAEFVITPGSCGCDRSACPALGTHRVELLSQDFYFCGHHWREMAGPLTDAVCRG